MRLRLVACALVVAGCEVDPSEVDRSRAGSSVPDSAVIRAGELEPYTYTALDSVDFDVDADGTLETIHLLATVERNPRGELLWEDGHHWAVLVTDDSLGYPLFERFLPWGRAEVLALREDAGAKPVIVVRTSAPPRCSGETQTLGEHVERFAFDAEREAFVREATVDASGTGTCIGGNVQDGSEE